MANLHLSFSRCSLASSRDQIPSLLTSSKSKRAESCTTGGAHETLPPLREHSEPPSLHTLDSISIGCKGSKWKSTLLTRLRPPSIEMTLSRHAKFPSTISLKMAQMRRLWKKKVKK